jgi:glutathione S-transferase
MKLYYPPRTSCSMAPHVALREAGLRYSLEKVELAATTTGDGAGYSRRGAAECVMGKA